MPIYTCPECGSRESWELRRNSRRCKKCRKEWTPERDIVRGVRASRRDWRIFLRAFLRYRTVRAISQHVHISNPTAFKMSRIARGVMAKDVPGVLSGVIEADETYIGTQWINRKWSVRKHGTKRGRGTTKQPIFGILERGRGIAKTFLVPNVQKKTLLGLIRSNVKVGSMLYSDGYQAYQHAPRHGYGHDWVDHEENEYKRGDVSTNALEGFWGVLKRRLKTTGGIRMDRLHEFVAEETWRYNHRRLPEQERVDHLIGLLKEFGGK